MEGPQIPNRIRDRRRKVTFVVMAYRELSREETVQAVTLFLQKQRGKTEPNTEIEILTSIGANG